MKINDFSARSISKEFEKRRSEAFAKQEERIVALYKSHPEIFELDREINLTGAKLAKIQIINPSAHNIKIYEDHLEMLKKEKEALLEDMGYSRDHLLPQFSCKKCQDMGYIQKNGVMKQCSCFSKYIFLNNMRFSGVDKFEKVYFEDFNMDFYSEIQNKKKYGSDRSPKENASIILQKCKEFVDDFNTANGKNLYFCGKTGTGKSHMIHIILNEVLKKGGSAVYKTSPDLFETIGSYKKNKFTSDDYDSFDYNYLYEADLLAIDDLGTESQTVSRYAELLMVLESRLSNNKSSVRKTIIATNLTPSSLLDFYDERISSRIIGNFNMFLFYGDDIRIKK